MKTYFNNITYNWHDATLPGYFTCVYCFCKFHSNSIKEYTDNGLTIICPRCGIDAVIHSSKESNMNKIQFYHNWAFK